MAPHVLAVDVGNSRFKFGLFDAPFGSGGLPACVDATAVPLADDLPWETISGWIRACGSERVQGVVAGANPAGIRKVLGSWPTGDWDRPTVVDDPSRFPLETRVISPETVGIDRLLNAIAANVIRADGRPVVVVDSGTATTVDALDGDGRFLGGAILPGFELAARSLHLYTALLPLVPVADLEGMVPAIGRDTRTALKSGLYHGQVGAVRELVSEMSGQFAESAAPCVLLTGGGAHLLGPRLAEATHEPHLTLQGLVLAAASPS